MYYENGLINLIQEVNILLIFFNIILIISF